VGGGKWYREGCGWFGGQIVMVMVEWWYGGGRKTWMSILYAFAGLFQAKTPRATRIPVPARHVDHSAVIEVGGVCVCVLVEERACVAWEARCFCWTKQFSAHEDRQGKRWRRAVSDRVN